MDDSPRMDAPVAGPRRYQFRGVTLASTLAALGLAFLLTAAPGCGGGTSGDEGTVDLVQAQEAAANNPAIAKKAARLGGGLGEPPPKKGRK